MLLLLLFAAPASAVPREEVLARAQAWVDAGVMYSWDAWYTDPSTGSCCYRTDCSGYVSAVWGIDPPGNTTYSFAAGPWDNGLSYVIDASELRPGDALNYPGDPHEGTGHVMLYVSGDFWSGYIEVYEEYTHGQPATHRWRSIDPYSYLPIRYVGIEDCSTEVCDGADNDCDGRVDEDWVCTAPHEAALSAWRHDPAASTDVDGDGRADLCAHAAAGLTCQLSDGAAFRALPTFGELSNAAGFDQLGAWSSLRLADVTGDGRADVCARDATVGFRCWPSTGDGFGAPLYGPQMNDAQGWWDESNYATLRMADVDGDGRADLCGRGDAGFYCWLSDGAGFPTVVVGPTWSDGLGWGDLAYAGTIRMGDLDGDGKADTCARAGTGVECWRSDGTAFPTWVPGPALSDSSGWGHPEYYDTIELPDVNGDGRADLCARASDRVYCWLSDGAGFPTRVDGPPLSNAAGWSDYGYYSTLRWGDVTGDGRDDLCARGAAGVYCWASTGEGFGDALPGPAWSDALGWYDATNLSTLSLGDLDGDGLADVCARSDLGVRCALATGAGFGAEIVGPEWSDASGWAGEPYYGSMRLAGGGLGSADPGDSGGDGGPGDSADGDTGPADTGPDRAEVEHGGAGCGCTPLPGPPPAAWLALSAPLAALLRRRRPPPPRRSRWGSPR